MGSCYSCRSNGGLPTYTTVAMATTTTEPDSSSGGGKSGRGSSIRGGGSFGFRRRTPVSVKSQSKERTSELVHLYETKISNLCNTNNSRHSTPSSSPIIMGSKDRVFNGNSSSIPVTSSFKSSVTNMSSHFGFGGGGGSTGSMTSSRFGVVGRNLIADANCNDIVNDERLGKLSLRERFFMSDPSTTATTKYECEFGRENKPAHQSPPHKPQADDVRNGNVCSGAEEIVHRNEFVNSYQLPYMVKTQISGLPRPQVALLVDNRKPEAMQISADDDDNPMFEADSGLGNSTMSERKTDGDTETLAEVEQIEGDAASLTSRGNRRESPEKMTKPNQVSAVEQVTKVSKPSGIARYRYASPGSVSNKTPPQQQSPQMQKASDSKKSILADKVSPKELNPIQAKTTAVRKIPLAVQLSNKGPSGGKTSVKKGLETTAAARKGVGSKVHGAGNSGKWETLTDVRQKENITPEVVEVVPIKLPYSVKSENVAKTKSPLIESVLPSTIYETVERKRNSLIKEDEPPKDFHQELGPYSPPSEKDFFLIDDEIADQPGLIACQQLTLNSFDSRDRRLSSVLTDMNEGGMPAMAQVHSSPKVAGQRRRPSHSVDTLSPCSSIDSEDLMLDFERLDDGCHSRPLSEVFTDGFQLTPSDMKSKDHFVFSKLNTAATRSNSSNAGADVGARRSSLTQRTNWIGSGSAGKGVGEVAVVQNTLLSPSEHNSAASIFPASSNARKTFDDADATLDLSTYRLLTQDITNVKTLLLRLKRVLQEAETANPILKNGLIPHSNNTESSGGKVSDDRQLLSTLEQENADLRRQLVYLQQQLEERDRSIRILQQQQQLSRASMGGVDKGDKAVANAACQTERQRSALNSFLTSVNEENSFGSTVSRHASSLSDKSS